MNSRCREFTTIQHC